MKRITHFIPNTLTLCNLVSGSVAIIFAFSGQYSLVFWAIIAAAVFDFLDGFAARMLKAHSPLGADLDSLADMVSFGVAPALTMVSLMAGSGWVAYVPLVLACGAALRLAKFNTDDRQHEEFRGLPTPAMTLFFVSFLFVAPQFGAWLTAALSVLFAGLMVCDLPMFSLKFSNFSVRGNVVRYVFIALSGVAVVVWGVLSPAIIVVVYVLFSVVTYLRKRVAQSRAKEINN